MVIGGGGSHLESIYQDKGSSRRGTLAYKWEGGQISENFAYVLYA